jgi:galacturonokinase
MMTIAAGRIDSPGGLSRMESLQRSIDRLLKAVFKNIDIQELRREVVSRFGASAGDVRIVVAPYRICPLGAHIDHQLGPVTAMAIDRAVHLAVAPSKSREIRLSSLSFPGEVRFTLDSIPNAQAGDWGNYVRGAAKALAGKHNLTKGIVGVTAGQLAEGGLSSSAAFGVACLMALEDANGLSVSRDDNILLDQEIENGYLGLRNGILDQSAILLSRRDQLTLLDCRTREHELVPPGEAMPPFTILLAFSGLTKSLVTTDYNRRVDECSAAARTLLASVDRADQPTILGNIRPEEYAAHKQVLEGPSARRAEHFFTEVDRVHRGVAAWREGNLSEFGRLMSESCQSSIHNYECGATPLVVLFELLTSLPGVYGARFSGAGFRGCCVALVDSAAAEEVAARVDREYKDRIPELASRAGVLLCSSDDGARII